MKGRIIVIEGTDCSGKETQTQLLVTRLKREGRKIELFSFPDYNSPTGKIVAGPYLGKTDVGPSWFPEGPVQVDPKVAALFYAADRKYNSAKIIELLENGYDVILDRYVESNMAHQGCKLETPEERQALYKWLDTLEYGLLELPKPDVTFFLHMPYKKVMELKRGRTVKDGHENSMTYLKNSEAAYMELASLKNHQIISCTKKNELRDILEIHEEIYQKVKEILRY